MALGPASLFGFCFNTCSRRARLSGFSRCPRLFAKLFLNTAGADGTQTDPARLKHSKPVPRYDKQRITEV